MVSFKNFRRFLYKVVRQPSYAFDVALKRVRANISYVRKDGISCNPEAITLFLTHRCNLRCKMCGQWGESGVTKELGSQQIKEELSFEVYKGMLDEVSLYRPNITLFGGEPLLYSHCMDLIRYIKDKKMHCLMISNGALLKDFAARLVDSGLDEFNLSLDGNRQLHDQIRGLPGLFDMISEGLKELNRVKKEKGVKKPLINLQCTVTKYNYEYLEDLIEVAKDVGTDSLTFHNLIFLDKELLKKQEKFDKALDASSKAWEGFVFSPEIDVDKLHKKIQSILSRSYSFGVDFYPNLTKKGLKEYYDNPSYMPHEYQPRCLSPWIVAYVFPDGEVKPCLNSTYTFGNIKDKPFKKIWNSSKAIKFRKTLKSNKMFPVCARCTELYRY